VDQINDLAASQKTLGDTRLFGNIDPVAILQQGGEAEITDSVRGAIEADVDAVWPGCDLVPLTPLANISAMLRSAG
jgi:[methyl-Co(III) methanol-specific corrinoid protein]:coenzyme M methyltransferase